MTKVYTEDLILPSADLGVESPLPNFRTANICSDYEPDKNRVPMGYDRIGYGWNTGGVVLPYRMQDGYNRDKKDRAWFSVVLENEYIKAVVVPGMGGKLYSLFDKKNNKDLFFSNPVFQPGNLGIRNAWTSGGAEYNFGKLGHHYQTCDPLHCSIIETSIGKIVRIFTWDRIGLCSYHYDFCLPDDSPYLLTYVRIINPNKKEIPVYWWTNIAVPVQKGGRTIAPANTGYLNTVVYDIREGWKGEELTQPSDIPHAYDIFFRIPIENQRKWEVCVDKEGNGILYASTDRLVGRKLFTWGGGKGGRHWNEFLSSKECPSYLEIQGGLAYSQMHSVPMPSETEWDWLEVLGAYEGSKEAVTCEWEKAYEISGKIVDEVLPQWVIDAYFAVMQKYKNKKGNVVFKGQGWGALENYRAKVTGKPSYIPEDFDFSEDDMTEKQSLWKEFIETGILREPKSVFDDPGEYMVQEEWFELLKKSAKKDNNWFVNFHIGVCYMERVNYVNARAYFQISNDLKENSWATYGLATICSRVNKDDMYYELMEKAYKLDPTNYYIFNELTQNLFGDKKYEELDRIISIMDPSLIKYERVKLSVMKNAIKKNDFATIEKYIDLEVSTNREGELSLSELWFEMMARKRAIKAGVPFEDSMVEEFKDLHDKEEVEEWEILPEKFDFRMDDDGDFYTPPTER